MNNTINTTAIYTGQQCLDFTIQTCQPLIDQITKDYQTTLYLVPVLAILLLITGGLLLYLRVKTIQEYKNIIQHQNQIIKRLQELKEKTNEIKE
jgi:hypothetical protein